MTHPSPRAAPRTVGPTQVIDIDPVTLRMFVFRAYLSVNAVVDPQTGL